ncbi:hypothetical protein GPL15_14950 [Clostridium sp. MCC353]|uniref:hypothetical protein n=1 Tax=Clostridium sp. MCC353 TaxID=2592646 RepID=UPI001C023FF4|nr:hypothetical protein [Clostridium sp. MCC353]MBT9777801.1 hypothetical protein [Clostridium sp. MCC353]
MVESKAVLKNKYLEAVFRLPGCRPESQRFDSCGMIEQVTLNGRHTFCVPEQLDEKRVTTYGFGLCSEFIWNDLACERKSGEEFPKLGVGIFKQIEDGMRFDKWNTYEVSPFEKTYEIRGNKIIFRETPRECMGVAAEILKAVSLYNNTITVSTTIENVGTRKLELAEFQHNFTAIDGLPAGPGYRLELPFDGELENGDWDIKTLDDRGVPDKPAASMLKTEGNTLLWKSGMDQKTFHKITRGRGIRTLPEYSWKLSHEMSAASVREICHFLPDRFSLWSVEHVISTEVFCRIGLEPGERIHFARTWLFEDETTDHMEV